MRAFFAGPIFLLFLTIQVWSQDSFDAHYTVEDGLPSNTVYAVEQDERGFIWFGTDSGLSRFDGEEFTNYTLEDGLPDTEILNFYKDSQSRIWFYTLNGKVGFLKNGVIHSSANTEWLKALDFDGRINSIVDFEGKTYFTSTDFIVKVLQNKRVSRYPELDMRYMGLCICNDSLRVIGQYNFITIKNDSIKSKKEVKYTPATYMACFKNSVYGFYDSEFFLINTKSRSIPGHSNSKILNIKTINGDLFLFKQSGIFKINGKDPSKYTLIKNLKSPTSMLIDQASNRWLTTLEQGIYRTRDDVIKVHGFKDVSSFSIGEKFLYVAHNKSIISRFGPKSHKYNFLSFPPEKEIFKIQAEEEDQLWIRFYKGISMNGQESIKANPYPGHVFIKKKEYLYEGIGNGLNRIDKKGNYKSHLFNAYSSKTVLDILTNHEDSLLLGTRDGLWSFANEQFFDLNNTPILKTRIQKLSYDIFDNLWMATGENGVLKRSKTGQIEQFLIEDGLSSNVCSHLLVDKSFVWVVTSKGLNKIDVKEKGQYTINDFPRGLIVGVINDIIAYNDSIYIGTTQGLYVFSNQIDLSQNNDFKVFINKVKANGKLIDVSVFHKVSNIEITYQALLFNNRKSLKYQYVLTQQGVDLIDPKWSKTSANTISFSNLPPKKYSLWIRAKTKNSDWTEPIHYDFEIVPAWWQRRSVQLGGAVLLVFLGFLSIRNYYQIKSSQKSLERDKISSEIKALKAQINPHFLFNSLNSIQSFLLEGDIDHADEYLIKYSKLIRKVLDLSDQLTVTLAEELELLSLYISLEQLRFEQGFQFNVILDKDINPKTVQIPSMILQPLIENAIWHGISPLKKQGIINLIITKSKDFYKISVEDNGVGFETNNASKKGKHISKGSKLVSERLHLVDKIEGIESNLNIQSNLGEGTKAHLKFPINLN